MRIAGEDRAFLERFTAGETPKEGFRHADHVRLAWLLLAEAPLLPALLRFRSLLKAFAAHHGATGLYNETITCFYMLLIAEAMQGMDPDHGWEDFRSAQPELFGYPKALLERYYPAGLAFSPDAKASFLLPEDVPRAA
ncbi:MAG TPA: hypothetical protein VGS99_05880 [Gammaproteobacteria bacterium]|nr:hypothetical protein [Gammaproteobacteria bacterium]